jgi:hypothetical protein
MIAATSRTPQAISQTTGSRRPGIATGGKLAALFWDLAPLLSEAVSGIPPLQREWFTMQTWHPS